MSDDSVTYWRGIAQADPLVIFELGPGHNYEVLATACVLFYDYVLTLPDEVRFVRNRPFSFAMFLFLLLRYGSLVCAGLSIYFGMTLPYQSGYQATAQSCNVSLGIYAAIQFLITVGVSAFVAVRIMALWSGNRWIGVMLFVLGLINPATLAIAFDWAGHQEATLWPMARCIASANGSPRVIFLLRQSQLPLVLSIVNIVYELMCLVFTYVKTFGLYRSQLQYGIKVPLARLLLLNGCLYFVTFLLLDVDAIVASFNDSAFFNAVNPQTLARALTPILTTRFISSLHQSAGDARGIEGMSRHTTDPAVDFGFSIQGRSRFVGSLGGMLCDEAEKEYDSPSSLEMSRLDRGR